MKKNKIKFCRKTKLFDVLPISFRTKKESGKTDIQLQSDNEVVKTVTIFPAVDNNRRFVDVVLRRSNNDTKICELEINLLFQGLVREPRAGGEETGIIDHLICVYHQRQTLGHLSLGVIVVFDTRAVIIFQHTDNIER